MGCGEGPAGKFINVNKNTWYNKSHDDAIVYKQSNLKEPLEFQCVIV